MSDHRAGADRALDLVRRIIDRTGPRLAGSPACHQGAALLAEAARPFADRVEVETFAVHPGAFLGFIRILVVLYLLALPCLVWAPWLAFVLLSLGVAILVLEFFLYREVTDPFYPRKEGRNVAAVLEPEGPVTRQIIISGHHDSARVFTFFVDRPELYGRRVNGGIGGFVLFWLGSLVAALALGGGLAFSWPRLGVAVAFAALLVLVLPLWRFAAAEGTPGAGDNLAASALALEVLRHYREARDRGEGLSGTRILALSFDAEEAGLRGARAYARRHREEFASLPTFAFNLDCTYDVAKLRILLSDLNGSVPLDTEATVLLATLARNRGLDPTVAPIAFLTGGTDAAELAKAGVRTTSVVAMDWSNEARSSVYHTPKDLPEAIGPGTLEALLGLGVDFVGALSRI